MCLIKEFKNIDEIFESIELEYNDYVIITDRNVYDLYLKDNKEDKIIVIEPGEDNKNLDTVQFIYDSLFTFQVTRYTTLVGIGGGIVSDITGYVASTYLRGLNFGFVPTTILGAVDASIGGKNGVNYNDYKNYIGTFREPEFIYWSLKFFSTLDNDNFVSGFGEIIKYAVGFDKELFTVLQNNDYSSLDSSKMSWIVNRCISIKSKIVESDKYELLNTRAKLNLGHTIAHAIEKHTHKIIHGKAVGFGLMVMVRWAMKEGTLSLAQAISITKLLDKYQVFNIHMYDSMDFHDGQIVSYGTLKLLGDSLEYIKADKKSINNEELNLIVFNGIGDCEIEPVNKQEFIDTIKAMFEI